MENTLILVFKINANFHVYETIKVMYAVYDPSIRKYSIQNRR
jgi:hypothetical protein